MSLETTINIIKSFSNPSLFLAVCLLLGLCLVMIYIKLLKTNSSLEESIKTFVSGFFLILLTYSPVIRSNYVFQDDYYLWVWQKGVCHTHPEYSFIFGIGRPIANIFLCPLFSIVETLEDANLVRFISIVLTSITFFIINRILLYLNFNKCFAYLAGLIVVTSFSFQVYNTWIMASYIPVGIIFSIFSIFIAIKLIDLLKKKEAKYLKNDRFKISRILHDSNSKLFCGLSILLYILSLSTYQPAAGFFTCFAAIYLLKQQGTDLKFLKLSFFVFGNIFVISNLVYFFIFRIFLFIFSYNSFAPSYDPQGLKYIFDLPFLINKLIWFFQTPFLSSANILGIESQPISLLFLVLFGISIISCLLRDIKSIYGLRIYILGVIYKYFFVAACIPLSYLSVLISDNSGIMYRAIAPLSTFCLITIFIGLEDFFINTLPDFRIFRHSKKFEKTPYLLLSLVCMFNILSANFFLDDLAIAHSLEMHYLKGQINSVPIQGISRITVIIPNSQPVAINKSHDLNHFSSLSPYHLHPMLVAAFSEMSISERFKEINIVAYYDGHKKTLQKGVKRVFDDIKLVQENYRGFNIVTTDDYFYAILQEEGEFSVERIQNHNYSIFFIANKHIVTLKKIDQYLEANEQLKKTLASENYREFSNSWLKDKLENNELVIDMNKMTSF